ncbi:NlpC/P60 family protein [uncultured Algibacter sp.]|uniref:NlpC/P60 family protein n=1 Tax=uncultured Algibacter sp. TaxID=298659 RepID=UPI0032168589
MSRVLIIFILLISSNLIGAQNNDFKSIVLEKSTSVPIEGAIVSVEKTILSTKTDDRGMFYFENVPYGEHVVTVVKEAYQTKFFLIKSEEGTRIVVGKVEMDLTKDEAERRKDLRKKTAKEEAEKIKEAKKAKKEKDKLLAKKLKKLKKENTIDVVYDSIPETPKVTFTATQYKYAEILGVPVENLTNNELYEFIDDWMGITYLMGGETREGIDCSSFTQRLSTKVYDRYIERTAEKQYDSKYTDKFTEQTNLKEGDLIFFEGVGQQTDQVTHVGIYLNNDRFVHSTSVRDGGVKGVKVSNLKDAFWNKRFICGGRRTD